MRIFILASWYPSAANPALGRFVEEQAVVLAKRHQVLVIAPESLSWRRSLIPRRHSTVAIERRRGVDVVRVQAGTPIPWSWRVRQASYVRAVQRAFEEASRAFGKPDVLHAHVVLPGGDAALRTGRQAGIPVVLTEHSNPFSMHLTDRTHRSRTAATLSGMDAVVAVSPNMRDQIQAFRPQTQVLVHGNVIDTEFFRPSPNTATPVVSEEFSVLSVGLLTRSKGMDRVIEGVSLAVPAIARRVTLTIVGDGPEREELEAQARRSSIADRIRFVGGLDRAGVRDAMQRSSAFVLASQNETFGVVVAEAMACGCPVVATRSGGPDWVVPPGCGLLVPVGDASALADALVALAEGRARVDIREARRSIIERFGQEAITAQLEGVYRDVLSSR
jgi:glycosyltransferase involved in cell wall biosynthesis